MPQILVMNPEKKKKKPHGGLKNFLKKKGTTMPKAKGKEIVKYKTRKPSKNEIAKAARAIAARGRSHAKLSFAGLHIGEAAKNGLSVGLGILAAQFAAKKFTDGGGANENWGWKQYIAGPLGGLAVGFAVSAVLGGRTKIAQNVFTGAIAYTAWKAFHDEVVTGNSTLEKYFGQDDVDGVGFFGEELHPDYQGADDGVAIGEEPVAIGDMYQGQDGEQYVMGANGWYPIDESHRMPPGGGMMGDDNARIDPRMGDDIVRVNPRMGSIDQDFRRAYAAGF